MNSPNPILLVEDDEVDAMIIRRVFNDLKISNELLHRLDGEEALSYLTARPDKLPCLILLDLNMPKMNGFEFIKAVKADMMLSRIPVVILTTSNAEQNIIDCFQSGVAGYIVKPIGYAKFVETIKILDSYWTLSKLPTTKT